MISARTRLNEMRARRIHPADTKDAAAEFLYWSDYARELRSIIVDNRGRTDISHVIDDAWNELDRINGYRRKYVELRWLDFLARHPTFGTTIQQEKAA